MVALFSTHLFLSDSFDHQISEEQEKTDGNKNALIVKKFDGDIVSKSDRIEVLGFGDKHLQVSLISLKDVTDCYNNLVEQMEELPWQE